MDGKVLQEYMPFDPAVLTDDDGRVYLYYGFAPAEEKASNITELTEAEITVLPDDIKEMAMTMMNIQMGEDGMVVELEPDMLTLKEIPRPMIPGGSIQRAQVLKGMVFLRLHLSVK